jgi:hypothetical protein
MVLRKISNESCALSALPALKSVVCLSLNACFYRGSCDTSLRATALALPWESAFQIGDEPIRRPALPRLKAHRQGIRDMNENSGPAQRHKIRPRSTSDATRASWSALSWGLVLAVFAGNVVLAIFAWYLVERAMTLIQVG